MTDDELHEQAVLVAEMLKATADKDEAVKAYHEQLHKIGKQLTCPVCGRVGASIEAYSRGVSIKCSYLACNFNPGNGDTLNEVLTRWILFAQALFKQKSEPKSEGANNGKE